MRQEPRSFGTFIFLWVTQSVSVFGDFLTVFGLNLWLTQSVYPDPGERPQLALSLAALNLAFVLPNILLAPVAGVWVDRLERRKVMLTAASLSAAVSLTLAALLVTNLLSVPLAVGLTALLACLSVFHEMAFDSSYVMVVPPAHLTRASGMMQTTDSLSRILAPGLAALLIALPALLGLKMPWANAGGGTGLLFVLDAASFCVAALALVWLRIPSPAPEDEEDGARKPRNMAAELREALSFMRARPLLLLLLGTFALLNICIFPLALFETLLLKVNLLPDARARGLSFPAALALMTAATGFGGVASGLLTSTWGGLKRGRIYGVLLPVMGLGVAEALLGLTRSLFVSVALFAVIGACAPFINAHSRTIWQLQVPPAMQGRVFALRRMIAQSSGPLSLAVVGWLTGWINPASIALVLGLCILLVGGAQLLNPRMRRIEDARPAGVAAD